MTEILNLEEQFAILGEANRPLSLQSVLKQGDTFAVFDPQGNITPGPSSPYGLYHAGTRFVSRLELFLGNRPPLLLSSTIGQDNAVFSADLTNPDILDHGRVALRRGSLHLFRSRVLWSGSALERIRVSNHALHPIQVPISLRFDADFVDVFEVRGTRRSRRGEQLPQASADSSTLLRYRGLDGIERRTRITPSRPPDRHADGSWVFVMSLEPHECRDLEVSIECDVQDRPASIIPFDDAVTKTRTRPALGEASRVISSNPTLDQWMRRSLADLRMLITDTPAGAYPYAGIPWFSTPFGRDGILTALELLWLAPDIARGVLTFLAQTQATYANPAQDAEPGKILHEMREGEMAALGEIPFGRYYGSADATPLFVMLASAYFERTADAALIDRLWPHILAALDWMEQYGDADGDGFIEYARVSESGLIQQGWKDSWDSIFHENGVLADPPIALSEIQGYAYAAWSGAARLALERDDHANAERWTSRAETLREQFEAAFWCQDLGTYALALDARKRPCRVRTSNAGHCLFSGIVDPHRARIVAETLLSDASFSGWGVRTVSADAVRYNPMSYHNGSVWPHDNAIIAAGFSRYGLTHHARRILVAALDLSQMVDLHRLPELICGFHRRPDTFPTLYPVACAPQAWAAGAAFLLLQSCLGLRIEAAAKRVSFLRPVLPEGIDSLQIADLRVAGGRVDLLLTRHAHDVGLTVLNRDGDIELVVVK
jgi:glycogen debranching enzyme